MKKLLMTFCALSIYAFANTPEYFDKKITVDANEIFSDSSNTSPVIHFPPALKLLQEIRKELLKSNVKIVLKTDLSKEETNSLLEKENLQEFFDVLQIEEKSN
ncbi:MAG: hypothetical protein HZB76_03290 [Chlamydiae bacterium]|nr:hypothetical protein [Chlamydiota bacterium]